MHVRAMTAGEAARETHIYLAVKDVRHGKSDAEAEALRCRAGERVALGVTQNARA